MRYMLGALALGGKLTTEVLAAFAHGAPDLGLPPMDPMRAAVAAAEDQPQQDPQPAPQQTWPSPREGNEEH